MSSGGSWRPPNPPLGPPGPPPPGPPGPPNPPNPPPGFRCLSDTAVVTNTLSPTTTGLDQPYPGKETFQATFLPFPHSAGRFVWELTAVPPGPRKPVQSASAAGAARGNRHRPRARVAIRMWTSGLHCEERNWAPATLLFTGFRPERDRTRAAWID